MVKVWSGKSGEGGLPVMTRGRLQLSGRNNLRDTRTVFYSPDPAVFWASQAIGQVIPVTHVDCLGWEARDMYGKCHGDRWITDWYAAEALVNGLGLEKPKDAKQR